MADCFQAADILLPAHCDMESWAVIACDQFTFDSAYWDRVAQRVDGVPSALHMILPEIMLANVDEKHISNIHSAMCRYLENGVFQCYPSSFVYVERTLNSGTIRQGIIGMLDLEQYAYDPAEDSRIYATERTVQARVPPRVAIRRDAAVEVSHILMLCNDEKQTLIENIAARKADYPKLYDFDLMEGGGHITGWLLQGEAAEMFTESLRTYEANNIYLVGDGNHSLIAAKICYENLKATVNIAEGHPSRYALVELENIYSPSIVFEPIHRVITNTAPQKLLQDLADLSVPDGVCVPWVAEDALGEIYLPADDSGLAVSVLQNFLDAWLAEHPGLIDYIHDAEAARACARAAGAIGFLLPAIPKHTLFPLIQNGKTLPRKTFSLGHGSEKRYYLEGRKLK